MISLATCTLFCSVSLLIPNIIKHKKKEVVDKASHQLGIDLRKIFNKRVLGPEPPIISRIQTYHIQKVILKIERERSFQKAKQLLDEAIINLVSNDKYKSVQISVDVDPV